MTKVKDNILNSMVHEDGHVTLPRPLHLAEGSLSFSYYYDHNNPIPHNLGQIIAEILSKWNDRLGGKGEAKVSESYADKHKLLHINTKEKIISKISDGKLLDMDLEELFIPSLIVKIVATGLHEEFNNTIALNINENFLQAATGTNVSLCSNLTIMGFDTLYSTKDKVTLNGKKMKIDLPYILNKLDEYMNTTAKNFEKANNQIEKWKSTLVSKSDFHEFLGKTYTKIQVENHFRVQRRINELTTEEKNAPLNGQQLAKIAVEAAKPSHEVYNWERDETNLWSVVNYGTEVLKFKHGSDIATVLNANRDWVDLVNGYFLN